MKLMEALDSGGGHLLLMFLLVLVGAGLLLVKEPYGRDIMVGALASLMTALTVSRRATPPTPDPASPAAVGQPEPK